MRLTNNMKSTAIKKASDDLYRTKIDEAFEKIRLELLELVKLQGFRLAETIPKEWEEYITTFSIVYIHMFKNKDSISISLPQSFACRRSGKPEFGSSRYSPSQLKSVLEYVAIVEDQKQFESKLYSILTTCSTLNKLIETLPEMVKYYPASTNEYTALIPIDQINSMRRLLSDGMNKVK